MRHRVIVTAALFTTLAGCDGCRPKLTRSAPNDAASDAGTIVRVTEAAPMGPSPDRREIDVPITWIHLLSDPAPTGSTPYAVVGARFPCGYGPLYGTSERAGGRVRIRLRGQWNAPGPVPATIPPCGDRPVRSFLVSEGILRLGAWEVVDMVSHGPGDDPEPVSRVQHVVPDDAQLPPAAARWTRPCGADTDCASGGVCASVEGVGVCLPAVDPWLSEHGACPGGTLATDVQHGPDGGVATWRACVASCQQGACPTGLRCSARGLCLPSHGE
ncbi:MAG: hypothetical protein U0326_25100 [Polyangiales bacterium]